MERSDRQWTLNGQRIFRLLYPCYMNAQQSSTNRLTAFVFGAVFNLFAMGLQEPIILFAVKTAVGGFIWLIFQLIGSYLDRRIRRWEEKQLSASEKKYGEEEKHEDKTNNSTNSDQPKL